MPLPTGIRSVKLNVEDGTGASVGQAVLQAGTSGTSFTALPVGSLVIRGSAFDGADGAGTCLATGQTSALVIANSTTRASLTLFPSTMRVTPANWVLAPGATVSLSCQVVDGHGDRADVGGVTWSSSDQSVATVGQDGLVTAVQPGVAAISGAFQGLQESCRVTVTEGASSALVMPADGKLVLSLVGHDGEAVDVVGVEVPTLTVLANDAVRTPVGTTWEIGPFAAGTPVVLYVDSSWATSRRYALVTGSSPTWSLAFEDWNDFDYNDVVVNAQFVPGP